MTLRTGKSGRYRYYTCCTKARHGETGRPGRTVPMEKLDNLAAEYIEQRLLQPKRFERLLSHVLGRRTERAERRKSHIAELRKRAAEADAKLRRLYDAIENGIADLSDPMLKDRIGELKATRDQAALTLSGLRRRLIARGRASTAGSQDVCQDRPQAHADRWRKLPPRSPPRARPTGRSRPERTAHQGIENRAPAHPCRCFW
jgi:hypothetical protein